MYVFYLASSERWELSIQIENRRDIRNMALLIKIIAQSHINNTKQLEGNLNQWRN